MSAFLGPIHYWLYHKIQWHEDLLEDIYTLMSEKGEDTALIKHYTMTQFGAPERSELSSVIDGGNIHGWLQSKIQSVEYRMAYAITHAVKHNILSLGDLEHLYHENGKKAYSSYSGSLSTPQDMFKAIYDYLLDGMPCDRVNQPIASEDDAMIWMKKMCIHTEFWAAVGGDIDVFNTLRENWLNGFVSTSYDLEIQDGTQYKLMRRAA